jgi:hypothetical protein
VFHCVGWFLLLVLLLLSEENLFPFLFSYDNDRFEKDCLFSDISIVSVYISR